MPSYRRILLRPTKIIDATQAFGNRHGTGEREADATRGAESITWSGEALVDGVGFSKPVGEWKS